MERSRYYKLMLDEIQTIQNDDVRMFAEELLRSVPEYFFRIPASSSGKYHPNVDLGEGGLVRHSINVKRMLAHIITPECLFNFTDRERDLLFVADLFHDCLKNGEGDSYNHHTKFLHPVYAANFIILESVKNSFPYNDAKFIADAIISHMGQWNENKVGETMPKPETDAQKALHMADYLASRQGIEMEVVGNVDELDNDIITTTELIEDSSL